MSEPDWKYVVWVGGVDDYYTTYTRAKEHYDEWVAKGYGVVMVNYETENEIHSHSGMTQDRRIELRR